MSVIDSHELSMTQGKNKVEDKVESRKIVCRDFRICLEDCILGNITRMQLLQDDKVRDVGYEAPHLLEDKI